MARRGRPRACPEGARTIPVRLYLNRQECERLEAMWRASSVRTRADFLRRQVLGRPIRVLADDALLDHLSRLGNNLNQIAKALHTGLPVNGSDLQRVVAELDSHIIDLARRL